MAKTKKISARYWITLRPFEQEYIHQRVSLGDNIPALKMRINDARKQHPDYTAIERHGIITTPTGKFVHSGEDTRRYLPL